MYSCNMIFWLLAVFILIEELKIDQHFIFLAEENTSSSKVL